MSANQQADGAHRIARVNYPPRALGFLATFVAIVLLADERGLGTPALLMAVAGFLVYPHLAYRYASRAADSKRAELNNLLIDSAWLGAWAAVTAFNLWLTFALLATTLTNNAMIGGPARLVMAAASFVLAATAWVLFDGLSFQPHAGLGVTFYIAAVTLFYLLAVALTSHGQNNQLARAHAALVGNTRIFRSLLKFGEVSHQAADVATLCDRALDHFRRLAPEVPFGLLLFERERPRLLRDSSFRGVSERTRDQVLARLLDHNCGPDRDRSLPLALPEADMLAVPLHDQLQQASGYVVIGRELADRLGKLLTLFVNQLAGALQNKLLTERLRKAAETDSLTGLYNRGYLEAQLLAAIERKHRHRSVDFSVIMFDLIGLKRVNDTLGHEAGDRLIVATATRLRDKARATDVVARFGGDEFVVLCRGCRESDAKALARRLVAACQQPPGADETDHRLLHDHLAISVGVAGSDRHDPEQVLTIADGHMYEDKQAHYRRHGIRR